MWLVYVIVSLPSIEDFWPQDETQDAQSIQDLCLNCNAFIFHCNFIFPILAFFSLPGVEFISIEHYFFFIN